MRLSSGPRLQRSADRVGDLVVADLARCSRSRLVEQSIEPFCGKAPTPFADCIGVRAHLNADRLILQPGCSGQNDARPTRHRLAGLLRPG